MTSRSGGRLLLQCVIDAGTPLLTCVPGESFLPVLDALHDLGTGPGLPRLVVSRHEAAAANMAEAAGKLTGRAATCFVTRGPGATHASIALHTAYQDGTPLLLVVGQVTRAQRGREAFQEMDYAGVFGSSAKSVAEVDDADRIPEHVAAALTLAHAGRPGPVVLVVPEDVLFDETTAVPLAPSPVAVTTDNVRVRELCDRLAGAQRPLLVVGGPGWSQEVGDGITAYAERCAVPVAAAFRWQDAVDNRSPAYVGYLGLGADPRLRAHAEQSDLLVAFGPRLDDPTTDGFAIVDDRDPTTTYLVSQDAAGLAAGTVPGIAVPAALPEALAVLTDSSGPVPGDRTTWQGVLRAEHDDLRGGPAAPAEPDLAAVVRHVRTVLPDDAVVTNGAGNFTIWLQRYFEFRRFRTEIAPRNGAMGYGLPAGLAAAALSAGRPVVSFTGDGDFLMAGNELATAAQHGLRLVVVVVNNGMLGTIRMHQERTYPGRVVATDLHNPDFVGYATSFDVPAWRVTRTDEFPPAFAAALDQPGPALVEVRTDPRQLTPDVRLAAPG